MTRKEIKKASRDALGNNIFSTKWIYALVLLLVVDIILGVSSFVSFIISGPIAVGLLSCLLGVYRKEDEKINFAKIIDGFKNRLGDSIVVGILETIFICLWSLLFFIPGLIKSYSYALSMYLVREKGLGGTDAITESRKLMKGHKWDLFVLDLSFIGWYIVGCLCFGIGILWVAPYHQMARVIFFEDVAGDKNVVDVEVIG